MKLVSVRVQNYKCIDDSGKFSVRDLTCLAGKNEAGKTALLQALRRLNPVEGSEGKFDELMEYPRRRLHELSEGGAKAKVLSTEWELLDTDIRAVEHVLGKDSITCRKVEINRGYDNTSYWTIELNEEAIIKFFVSETAKLTPNAKERILKHGFVKDLKESLSNNSNALTLGEQEILDRINDFPHGNPIRQAIKILNRNLPKFLYFSTYGTLPGRVSVEDIASKQEEEERQDESERIFLALLALADTNINSLQESQRYEELKARLEAVSNRLSDEIFEYWTQNRDLQVDFNYDEARTGDTPPFHEGHVFSLRVRNNRHRVTIGFDERSAGFVWFFSFLVWFSQMEKIYGDKLIILLDEPGLSLHGKAQADLLRYIKEKLLPKYQVLYTTHSPFMIDTDAILSVRTVEDLLSEQGVSQGTKVKDKVLSADADTLFPLRAALGYDITQSLFVGEHSLLVEGPSDLLYLRWATRQLIAKGKEGLDPRWTITPVGGIDKVGSFNALFAGNDLHVAVFTDFHKGDKRKVDELRNSGLLQAGHVFSADEFVDQNEADIEDMLGRVFYIDLVNQCYNLTNGKRLPDSPPQDAFGLVLEEVKQHFRVVATDGSEFDHLSPAVYLIEHESEFINQETITLILSRFEKLFKSINGLLPPA